MDCLGLDFAIGPQGYRPGLARTTTTQCFHETRRKTAAYNGMLGRIDDGKSRVGFHSFRVSSPLEEVPQPTRRSPVIKFPCRVRQLFQFFRITQSEGVQCRLHHIDPNDDFTRLLKTTHCDVIGAVTVKERYKNPGKSLVEHTSGQFALVLRFGAIRTLLEDNKSSHILPFEQKMFAKFRQESGPGFRDLSRYRTKYRCTAVRGMGN